MGQSGLREDGATDPSSFSGIGSTHSARSLASYYAAAVGKTGVRFTQAEEPDFSIDLTGYLDGIQDALGDPPADATPSAKLDLQTQPVLPPPKP